MTLDPVEEQDPERSELVTERLEAVDTPRIETDPAKLAQFDPMDRGDDAIRPPSELKVPPTIPEPELDRLADRIKDATETSEPKDPVAATERRPPIVTSSVTEQLEPKALNDLTDKLLPNTEAPMDEKLPTEPSVKRPDRLTDDSDRTTDPTLSEEPR